MRLSVLLPPTAVNAHPLVCYTASMGLFRPAGVPPQETEQIIQRKRDWILAACRPREIWVFGSAARGELTEGSDIDLAVVCDDAERVRHAREAVYRQKRPDEWAQDIIFLEAPDFYARAKIGGLPMLIVEEGRRIYTEEEA